MNTSMHVFYKEVGLRRLMMIKHQGHSGRQTPLLVLPLLTESDEKIERFNRGVKKLLFRELIWT